MGRKCLPHHTKKFKCGYPQDDFINGRIGGCTYQDFFNRGLDQHSYDSLYRVCLSGTRLEINLE